MDTISIEELRRLDNAGDGEAHQRYQAICERRDAIISQAVIRCAGYYLGKSEFVNDLDIDPEHNNQNAVTAIQEYLSQDSSIPEMDQRLLALVGTGALFGKAIEPLTGDVTTHAGIAPDMLDPALVHRLARALDRCSQQEYALWRFINVQDDFAGRDGALVKVAIRLLLDDTTLGEMDNAFEKMVLDSIPGG